MKYKKTIDWIIKNFNLYFLLVKLSKTYPFLFKLKKCDYYQKKLLLKIIKNNKHSYFGKKHHFSKIKTVEDFQKNIPILEYEDLEPYINKSKKGKTNHLISDNINYFAITSGTTDHVKFIPHTKSYIKKRQTAWKIWSEQLFKDYPNTLSIFGSILTINSKSVIGNTKGKIEYGNVSGKVHDMQPMFVKNLYAVPDEVFEIEDNKIKNYLITLFSIKKNITLILTPNPSTLILFAKKLNRDIDNIIKDYMNNNIEVLDKLKDNKLKRKILKKFKSYKNNKIASKLLTLKFETKKIYPKHIFKHLVTVASWRGGNVGIYTKHLKKYYGENIEIRDIGYMASEGRFSIPIESSQDGRGILDINCNFYEFIEEKYYDNNKNTTKLTSELKIGEKYYVIITNENGLYRYFLNDIIEVTSFKDKTPIIKFIQKGKYFSSITGEKISEWEIIDAIEKVHKKLNIEYKTFFVTPIIKTNPYYKYHIEFKQKPNKDLIKEIESELDNNLKKSNIEYESKRDSKRLGKIKVEILPKGSFYKLKESFSKNKSSDTQTKVPKLIVLEKDKEVIKNIKL